MSDHDFLLLLLGAVRVQFGYPYMGMGVGMLFFTRELGDAWPKNDLKMAAKPSKMVQTG